jgi:hypothetical protein
VTLDTGKRYYAGFIPIAEWHGVASEVTRIIAGELTHVTTKIFDGVVQQLDNILVAMGKRAGILV